MELRRGLMGLAGVAGVWLLAVGGSALAAPDAPVATQGPLRLIPKTDVPPPPPPPPFSVAPLPPPPAPAAAMDRPGQPVALPAPIPQPAPSADPAQPIRRLPAPPPPPVDGLETVRAFYAALAQADGERANGFLVPEKRDTGAYEIASMSRYYGNMREPLRLLAAEPAGPDAVRVRYHYVYANGRVCDGAADIALARRDGRALIERIRALNGC